MTKFWDVLRRYGKQLGIALLALFGVGAFWAARRRAAALAQARTHSAVLEADRDIRELQTQRAVVATRVGENAEAIAEIDKAIEENKSRIAAVHSANGLSAAEIADEFRRLGY